MYKSDGTVPFKKAAESKRRFNGWKPAPRHRPGGFPVLSRHGATAIEQAPWAKPTGGTGLVKSGTVLTYAQRKGRQ